jgi:Na+-transporting NADH:ubiquinone oxidoreductase subunit NqrC
MKNFTVKTEITPKKLAGLLCSAFEGGVGYWCTIKGYAEPKGDVQTLLGDRVYKHVDFPLQGGAVICEDFYTSDKTHRLNGKAIARGLQVMSAKYPKHFSDFLQDNYDALTGDAFVQCCLFGEVLYG